MGGGDKLQGKAYTRYLSSNIRKWSPKGGVRFIEEDPIIGGVSGLARCVMLTVCRNRQRLLQQAWDTWTTTVDVEHDYAGDMRAILSHPLKDTEMRSEFELEVMFKWVRQHALDVTGIAYNIHSCSSKKVICNCLQHLRLESFHAGDPILYQGALPKDEDGHLTILHGSVDVVKFALDSISFIKLQQYAKRCSYESARKLLLDCTVLATLETNAGFGELSTLTGVKRAVTIRASVTSKHLTDVLIISKAPFIECLEHRRGTHESDDSSPSEAIELFRQTGLAARINPQELVSAAASMRKISLTAGEVLYRKGEKAERLFLVVSGDIALDTMDPAPYKPPGKAGKPLIEPFLSSNEEHVFHLSGGSILGDEGILGLDDRYMASAAVASDRAVVFEAVGFARKFLHDRVKAMRYAALVYKELPRWTVPIPEAESNNLYGYLNSLRRVISVCRPTRGVAENWHVKEDELVLEPFAEVAPLIREIRKKKAREQRNNSKKDGVVADGDKEKEAALAIKKKKAQAERKKAAAASKVHDAQRKENLKKRRNKKRGPTAANAGPEEEGEDHLYKDAAGNVLVNTESGFSRLCIPALNAAKSLNAASKKLQHDSVQMHARNNLLQDQLLREAAADDKLEAASMAAASQGGGGFDNGGSSMGAPLPNLGATSHAAASPEAMMRRSARKHQVHELTERFNEALSLYHARQEKYVEEEEEEEEEVLRVGEAANMVSMFKQAAAGAYNAEIDEASMATGEQSMEDSLQDYDLATGSYIEGVHSEGMSEEERVQAVQDLLSKPRIDQYLSLQLRLEAMNRKRAEVEKVDMSATFAASSDSDADFDSRPAASATGGAGGGAAAAGEAAPVGVVGAGEGASAAQELLDFKRSLSEAEAEGEGEGGDTAEQQRLLLGKDWDATGMPVPEIVNATNWRPPSSSSTRREVETGGLVPLLSPTHSRPTTREVKDLRPSSPWKQREYQYLGQPQGEEGDAGGEIPLVAATITATVTATATGEEAASLQSLQFDENHYKTHAARMKLVPSSGYGQEHIEAAAQEALGMTLKEFNNINTFSRLPAPQGMRRMVLPPAIEKMRRAREDSSKKASKRRAYVDPNDPLHALQRQTGHFKDLDEQFSSWSVDLDSPEGFLAELQKKDFSKRKEFLARNGWNTRAMRVTDNSRPVVEVSNWLREDFEKMAAREEEEEHKNMNHAGRTRSPRKVRASERQRKKREEEEEALWASLELGAQTANLVHTEEGEGGDDEASRKAREEEEEGDEFSTGGEHALRQRQRSSTLMDGHAEEKGSDRGSNPPSRGEPAEGELGSGLHSKSFMSQSSANSSANDVLDGEGGSSRVSMRSKKKKVEEAPSYHEAKLPSNAIKAYQEARATEYTSRKFLDGKKKNNVTSKFKLAPVPVDKIKSPAAVGGGEGGDVTSMESSLDLLRPMEMRAAREKDKALIASLVPEQVSMLQAIEKIRREAEKKEREKERAKRSAALVAGTIGAGPATTFEGHGDHHHSLSSRLSRNENDIHAWQNFSVHEAVRSKLGPHKSLPVLSLKGADPLLKPPKKSSLKYGGGMARVEGYDEISFQPVSSYLDVFTRSFKGDKGSERVRR